MGHHDDDGAFSCGGFKANAKSRSNDGSTSSEEMMHGAQAVFWNLGMD